MQTAYHESVINEDGLFCFRCNVPLESDKVFLSYLQSSFPTQLLKCPKCGLVYIGEEMATTKAVEVEKTVEGK